MAHSQQTLEFAAMVVKLRDEDGLSWRQVAERLDLDYDNGGAGRPRRAYTIGGGATRGARSTLVRKDGQTNWGGEVFPFHDFKGDLFQIYFEVGRHNLHP